MKRNKGNTNHLLMNYFIRKSSILLLFILCFAGLFVGCGKKNEQAFEQQNITSVPENEITMIPTSAPTEAAQPTPTQAAQSQGNTEGTTSSDEADAINNGGLYVEYKGDYYYRQYNTDSYEPTGLWGYYNATINTDKSMMRLKADGTVEEAFADTGEGDIYIWNDRMYLQKPTENLETILYSVGLDGSNRVDLGIGTMVGIDETSGTLIAMMADENDLYHLSVINGSTGKAGRLTLTTPCTQVLAVKDGFIYYKGEVVFAESDCGKLKLCRVAIDGTGEKLLVETNADLYSFGGSYGMEVPCLQFVGDTLYFSYGGYSGTGYFYQGGCIARVNIDGSGFEYLSGADLNSEGFRNPNTSEMFYIANENGKEILYYSQTVDMQETPFSLDLNTMEVASSDFLIHAEGDPFEFEGGISIYQNGSSTMTALLPKVDYSTLGFDEKSDYYFTVKEIQLCDNWVYYKIEANEIWPEASIGWRDGYKRIKTQVIREELNGDSKEILYEY